MRGIEGRRRAVLLAALLALLGAVLWVTAPWRGGRRVDPEQAAALMREGTARRQRGDLRGAADAFRKAVALAPDWADARLQLGAVYMAALEYDLARKELERGVRLAPENAAGWGQLGKLYLTTLQFDAAERALAEALRLVPDRGAYVAMLGEVYRLRGDPKSVAAAVEQFRRALALDPNNSDAYHRLGLAYQRLGRLGEAAVALAAATRAAPDAPQPYLALAQVERQRGRTAAADQATRTFRRLEARQRAEQERREKVGGLTPGPGGPGPSGRSEPEALDAETAALLERGRRAFFEESETETAIQILQQARERAPEHPDVLYNLGLVLHFVGRLEEAEAAFRAALAANPGNPRYHAWIGTILLARGPAELPAAVAALEKSVEIGPDYAYGHYQLGRAYLLQNRPADAAPVLERAVRRNPRYREAYYSLSQAYSRLGRREDAARARARFRALDRFERERRHLSVLARAQPDDPAPRLRLARFLAEGGDREGAIRMLEAMTRAFPDHAPAARELARLRRGVPPQERGAAVPSASHSETARRK
jgi:tetratricopeptide (TPR) repeat protein